MTSPRTHAVRAGSIYFTIVFAAGFALGTVRVLLLVPRFGPLTSVLLELPLMLAVSWMACGWVVRRFQVPPRIPPRLAMGAIAFALLMLAEVILSVAVFGSSMSDYLRDLTTMHGLVGLGGQILFALFPLARRT